MYRKPTHTDRYLHFKSHHPNHVKRGIVRHLYQRVSRVTNMSVNLRKKRNTYTKYFNAMIMTMQPLGQALNSYLLEITDTVHGMA